MRIIRYAMKEGHRVPLATGGSEKSPLVRTAGHAVVRSPVPHSADGFRRCRLPGQAGDRHHQYLERYQSLSHAFQAAGRGGEARRLVVDRLNANPRVDEAHHRVSAAGFKYYVTEMACGAAGGPQQYSGRSMGDSHRHLEIIEEEWAAFMDDLQQT